MSEYPCKTCTKVKHPDICLNKTCLTWQTWFLERWQEVRNYYGMVRANFNCQHIDDQGYCRRYSNEAVVWKCQIDAACEGYEKGDAG